MTTFLLFNFLIPLAAAGQLRIAPIFFNHMILQRDQPVHVWGTGVPGRKVALRKEKKTSGMAVCSDIGEKHDVHPTNKKDVGKRLARWALCYTDANLVNSSNLPASTFKLKVQ